MLPDQISNPGPLTYWSVALPTALHGCTGRAIELRQALTVALALVSALVSVLALAK